MMIRKLIFLFFAVTILFACDRFYHYTIEDEDYRLLDNERFVYRCNKGEVMIDLRVSSIRMGVNLDFVVINNGPQLLEYDLEQISVIVMGEPYQVHKNSWHI